MGTKLLQQLLKDPMDNLFDLHVSHISSTSVSIGELTAHNL